MAQSCGDLLTIVQSIFSIEIVKSLFLGRNFTYSLAQKIYGTVGTEKKKVESPECGLKLGYAAYYALVHQCVVTSSGL